MLASRIKLSDLKTYGDCLEVIHDIENDYRNYEVRNYEGGITHWRGGKEVFMKAGALAKIAAIEKKGERLGVS